MTTALPRAVLSDHLEECLAGRRLLAAVFLTFQFDPAFFEQDILPVLFGVPLSHAPAIRLVQLEDAVRDVPHGVAVYYDRNGLIAGGGSSRLDVRRTPINHRTGVFHPKNVFLLVEEDDKDGEDPPERALIIATLSANLTRSGWWENVEVCHTEEVKEGAFSRLKDDVRRFLKRLRDRAGDRTVGGHKAITEIHNFLGKTNQRSSRSSDGQLFTHFYDGQSDVTAFIKEVAGKDLRGCSLEVLSPYFDAHFARSPLHDLIEEFAPKEVRVSLPQNEAGEVLCTPDAFAGLEELSNVSWGSLPTELLRSGQGAGARPRFVHAKVYRFFSRSPKREVLFLGSVNLTSAAHSGKGNFESGVLVERDLSNSKRPDWWLEVASTTHARCVEELKEEVSEDQMGTPLLLRYSWDTDKLEALWDGPAPSPTLSVSWNAPLFVLKDLPKEEWITLDAGQCTALKGVLRSTSIVTVREGDGPPRFLLVQEEGMQAKPSVLLDLSPSEVLRYWSLLTPAHRAEFIAAHAPELSDSEEGAALLTRSVKIKSIDTFFDRFAGIFLAFANVERSVRDALAPATNRANPKAAEYRLFGKKYDSLLPYLEKTLAPFLGELPDGDTANPDAIDAYVSVLCAKQMVRELGREFPEFFRAHRSDTVALDRTLAGITKIRKRIIQEDPATMPAFLDWFDEWFLARAARVEGATS